MVTILDVFNCLDLLAPVKTKMDFDNVGLLVGKEQNKVEKILVSLDVTDSVIEEAISGNADIIVSHHPLFFSLKNIQYSDTTGKKIINLIENNIGIICMHTNLDVSKCGVNMALADAVGISNPEFLIKEGINEFGEEYGLGMMGKIKNVMPLDEYLHILKKTINASGIRFYNAGLPVKKVAVLGGSGGNEIDAAVNAGCDTYITADVKYDIFLKAKELGINLIDGGHFCTENVVVPQLAKILSEKFKDVIVVESKIHKQPELFF